MELLRRVYQHLSAPRTVGALDEKHLFASAPLTYKLLAMLLGAVIVVISFIFIARVNSAITVEIPTQGGEIREGIVGVPRHINPILAVSRADKDLTALVFAGLMTYTPEGELTYELAESHTISEDGTTYTFTLKDNIQFHDGKEITAQDVVFTIERIQDPAINSPERGNWVGVAVSAIGDKQVQFRLDEAYTPFIHNTTIGIAPRHIWNPISAEQFAFSSFNIDAIGAGPYRITDVSRENGIPDTFFLTPFTDYTRGEPFIERLIIQTFQTEEDRLTALERGSIDSAGGIAPLNISEAHEARHAILATPLTRVFQIYVNQNRSDTLTDSDVRTALSLALDRDALIDNVLNGYGSPLTGPLPPNPFLAIVPEQSERSSVDVARELLDTAGWTTSTSSPIRTNDGASLSFTIKTSNNTELKQTAEFIRQTWNDIGVEVSLEFYDPSDLKQDVIRPREFELLLFGSVTDRSLDLYPLWHASQRNDPGLNLAQYANIDVDENLEIARTSQDADARIEALKNATDEIAEDMPALFLYSPHFIYLVPETINNNHVQHLVEPHERFIDIHTWFIDTRNVWLPFVN